MEFIGRVFGYIWHAHVQGYKLLSLFFFGGVSHVSLVFPFMRKKARKVITD